MTFVYLLHESLLLKLPRIVCTRARVGACHRDVPFYPLVLKLVVCVCQPCRARASTYRMLGWRSFGLSLYDCLPVCVCPFLTSAYFDVGHPWQVYLLPLLCRNCLRHCWVWWVNYFSKSLYMSNTLNAMFSRKLPC